MCELQIIMQRQQKTNRQAVNMMKYDYEKQGKVGGSAKREWINQGMAKREMKKKFCGLRIMCRKVSSI